MPIPPLSSFSFFYKTQKEGENKEWDSDKVTLFEHVRPGESLQLYLTISSLYN